MSLSGSHFPHSARRPGTGTPPRIRSGLLSKLAAVNRLKWFSAALALALLNACSKPEPKPPTQEELVQRLIEQMSNPEPSERMEAISITKNSDFPLKAKKRIAEIGLDDNVQRVQIPSIEITGEKPSQADLKKVMITTHSDKPAVSEVSMQILRNQGPPGKKMLVEDALKQVREENAEPAPTFRKLRLSFQEVKPPLDEMLQDDPILKLQILASLDKNRAENGLFHVLYGETDPDRLYEMLIALDHKGVPFSIDFLYARGNYAENVDLTRAVIHSLGRIRDPRSAPVLEKMAASPHPSVQNSAEASLRSVRGY